MPRTGAQNVLDVAWTDHRIRKRPEPGSAQPPIDPGGDLTPVFSPGATARDQAMANYQALLDGDPSREPAAWAQLNAPRGDLQNDKDALDALGNMSAERGERGQVQQAFRRVLDIDPTDLTALSNLGTLLAKEGKVKEGEALLRKAFDRNQDLPGLAMNLARVQCMQGEGESARSTLAIALIYSPNLQDLQRLVTQLGECRAPGVN
jgi:Flp pilus assembly protein TadD